MKLGKPNDQLGLDKVIVSLKVGGNTNILPLAWEPETSCFIYSKNQPEICNSLAFRLLYYTSTGRCGTKHWKKEASWLS